MDIDQENIWTIAKNVTLNFPVSYNNLMGEERLAVLHLLDEPVQSILHQIIQQNVTVGTQCLYNHCSGTLNQKGRCSERCEQSQVNVVQDILECQNCDCYCFPCPSCYHEIFRKQLPMYVEH